jgi:predicted TIM-barrel fold metal-dependent hydrolase
MISIPIRDREGREVGTYEFQPDELAPGINKQLLHDVVVMYEANRRVVLEAIEIFGVERCMFASNFPVDGLRVSFDRMFGDFKRMTASFSTGERRALFHDNAAHFYRL